MEEKDLEQLFREKFKDFYETPDERVWKSIESSLDKKKKKRVVPIWWQLGGVAALFTILLYVINPFSNSSIDNNTVTDTEQHDAAVEKNNEEIDFQESVDSSNSFPDAIELTESEAEEKIHNDKGNTRPGLTNNLVNSQESAINSKRPKNEQLASNENSEALDNSERKDISGKDAIQDNKEAVAEVSEHNKKDLYNKNLDNLNSKNSVDEKVTEEVVAENVEKVEGKSIFDAIEEQEEQKAVAKTVNSKWSVGPSVAPVYFNGIGEGSPVHSNFSANSKSGNVNLSYGLNVAYELNKRLSVRTGIHKVNYGYDTNEIVFSSSPNASTNQNIDNIDYNQTSRGLVVQSKASPSASEDFASNADVIALTPELEGRMVQQLGYMEVPLELNYALVDKKFGVNLIGGVSSLFLVDNAVSLESDGLVTEMGEANNVNDVNFSTNVGIGLNYKFSQKIQANLEPVFKYQLNTFSDTAGDFRPFSVGVYSGLSFKF